MKKRGPENFLLPLIAVAAVSCQSPEDLMRNELVRRMQLANAEMEALIGDLRSGKCSAVFDRGDLFDQKFMSGRLEDGFDVPYLIHCKDEKGADGPTAAVRYDERATRDPDVLDTASAYTRSDHSLGTSIYGILKGDKTELIHLEMIDGETRIVCTEGEPMQCSENKRGNPGEKLRQGEISQKNIRALADKYRQTAKRAIVQSSKVAPNPPTRILIRRGRNGKPESIRRKF